MNNKTKLITALRMTAKAIENKTFNYGFYRANTCNCGALVCALKGITPDDLHIPGAGYWSARVSKFCPISGIPTHELFRELIGYGLTPESIVHLENLSDPEVLARMPKLLFGYRRSSRKSVVLYMRTWADLLTERLSVAPDPITSLQQAIAH